MELGRAFSPPNPPPIPVFRADHPFLFAIRDRPSGAILFLGRMADPTQTG
jgi:serpin B